jgi:murein DD-endopeptidase MepM/ murein hydrolase activator NlpD
MLSVFASGIDGASDGMNSENFSSGAAFPPFFQATVRWGVGLVGGLSLLGGSLLTLPLAKAQEAPEAPVVEVDAPTTPKPTPVETSAESLLRPQGSQVAPSAPTPLPEGASVRPTVQSAPSVPDRASDFIDTTDYSVGATQSPDSPTLVFSDRATGCQLTLSQGQSNPTRVCGNGGRPGSAESGDIGGAIADQNTPERSNFSVGPVTVGVDGITVGGTTIVSREFLDEKLRPLNLLRRGIEEFVFPLAIPAPITSLFGWRTHPIFGDTRFHAGTDLGAPMGTPVLAAKDGEVSVAESLGGYGLTVILRHENNTQETRYAHLSQILVRPGEQIAQGEIIGLVGSTGNSTGPHLHFELRQLTAQGWVLANPNELLQYAMANLVQNLNQPLQALSALTGTQPEDALEETVPIPYRPAQPNAS